MFSILDAIYEWLNGFWDYVEASIQYLIDAFQLFWFDFNVFLIDFNLGLFVVLLQTTGYWDNVIAIYNSFPPEVMAGVIAMRIPEALNVILTAYIWKKSFGLVSLLLRPTLV